MKKIIYFLLLVSAITTTAKAATAIDCQSKTICTNTNPVSADNFSTTIRSFELCIKRDKKTFYTAALSDGTSIKNTDPVEVKLIDNQEGSGIDLDYNKIGLFDNRPVFAISFNRSVKKKGLAIFLYERQMMTSKMSCI